MLPMEEPSVDIHEMSAVSLAFLGDGVLDLLVRARLVSQSRKPPGALHREAAQIVSAHGQYGALQSIEARLTPPELAVVRRGRNANKASVSKNATAQEYRASTGLEALFGWLYLQNQTARIAQLFELIWQHHLAQHGQPCAGVEKPL